MACRENVARTILRQKVFKEKKSKIVTTLVIGYETRDYYATKKSDSRNKIHHLCLKKDPHDPKGYYEYYRKVLMRLSDGFYTRVFYDKKIEGKKAFEKIVKKIIQNAKKGKCEIIPEEFHMEFVSHPPIHIPEKTSEKKSEETSPAIQKEKNEDDGETPTLEQLARGKRNKKPKNFDETKKSFTLKSFERSLRYK